MIYLHALFTPIHMAGGLYGERTRRKLKPRLVSYGPFGSIEAAHDWATLRGVREYTLFSTPAERNIDPQGKNPTATEHAAWRGPAR